MTNHEDGKPTDQGHEDAFRFLDGAMPPADRDAYLSRIAEDSPARDALVDAVALQAAARLGLGSDGDPVDGCDPELCAQVRKLLPAFLRGAVSPGQREDMDEHLSTCEGCQSALAASQRGEGKKRGLVMGTLALCLVIGGGTVGWVLRGDGTEPGSAVTTGEQQGLFDKVTRENVRGAWRESDPRRVRALARHLCVRFPPDLLMRPMNPRETQDLKKMIHVVMRAGDMEEARQWLRPLLDHPHADVRQDAGTAYPFVDPDWKADPELRARVQKAQTASGNPLVPAVETEEKDVRR